jgi:hypothetical protein
VTLAVDSSIAIAAILADRDRRAVRTYTALGIRFRLLTA